MIFNAEESTQMNPVRTRVAAAHRVAVTVVLAIALGVAISSVAGLLLVRGSSLQGGDQSRMTMIVIAIFLALGSIAIRRTQLSATKIQSVVLVRGIGGLIKHLFTVTLILAAIAEGIGILSLLIARFGGTQLDVITFGLVAAIILVSNYPRRTAWERTVDFFASGKAASSG